MCSKALAPPRSISKPARTHAGLRRAPPPGHLRLVLTMSRSWLGLTFMPITSFGYCIDVLAQPTLSKLRRPPDQKSRWTWSWVCLYRMPITSLTGMCAGRAVSPQTRRSGSAPTAEDQEVTSISPAAACSSQMRYVLVASPGGVRSIVPSLLQPLRMHFWALVCLGCCMVLDMWIPSGRRICKDLHTYMSVLTLHQ